MIDTVRWDLCLHLRRRWSKPWICGRPTRPWRQVAVHAKPRLWGAAAASCVSLKPAAIVLADAVNYYLLIRSGVASQHSLYITKEPKRLSCSILVNAAS